MFLAEQRGKGAVGVSCSVFIMIHFCPLPRRKAGGQSVDRVNVSERFGRVNNTRPLWAQVKAGDVCAAPGLKIGASAASVCQQQQCFQVFIPVYSLGGKRHGR